ncbi:WGR domain-containing protein [Bradyrhizobium liaoningense]|uniref:WGR domain-containing protein n=1 Tax=Bradyrhizobium liaoningense TaxID=43992 RepID=UPI0032DE57B3
MVPGNWRAGTQSRPPPSRTKRAPAFPRRAAAAAGPPSPRLRQDRYKLLAESQPFGQLGFGQCAGSIIVIRNAEMGRAVACSAVQAPNLDATIRTGEAVGTIRLLIELCLAPPVSRQRPWAVSGRVESGSAWRPPIGRKMPANSRMGAKSGRAGTPNGSCSGLAGAASTAPTRDRAMHLQSTHRENKPIALVRFNNPIGRRFRMTLDAAASAGPCPSSSYRRSPQICGGSTCVLTAKIVRWHGGGPQLGGRIGTNDQTMMQSFDDRARAGEAFDRLERTRRRRGYDPAVENR